MSASANASLLRLFPTHGSGGTGSPSVFSKALRSSSNVASRPSLRRGEPIISAPLRTDPGQFAVRQGPLSPLDRRFPRNAIRFFVDH
jgi:hypothetical protein